MAEDVKFSNLSKTMQGILVFLGILGAVVPSVLGFVNFDKRLDIVEETQVKHISSDEKRFDKLSVDVEDAEDSIHALQLVDKGLTIQYAEILRRIDENREILNNLERVD
jgi:uncharacterized membrane protein